MTDTDTQVTRNDEMSRYEATVDGKVAGFAEFTLTERVITFVHTEVDDAYEGQGVGGALARGALDDVRARGDRRVKAVCPFIRAWIARHRDYQDLLVSPAAAEPSTEAG